MTDCEFAFLLGVAVGGIIVALALFLLAGKG